jgi:hypothetical protein
MYIFISLSYLCMLLCRYPPRPYFMESPGAQSYIPDQSLVCVCLLLYLYNYFLCLSVGWGGLQYNADLFDSNIRIFHFYLFSPYASLLLFIFLMVFLATLLSWVSFGIHCACVVYASVAFFDLLVKMRWLVVRFWTLLLLHYWPGSILCHRLPEVILCLYLMCAV